MLKMAMAELWPAGRACEVEATSDAAGGHMIDTASNKLPPQLRQGRGHASDADVRPRAFTMLQAWLPAILLSMNSHYKGRDTLNNRVPTRCLGCESACNNALYLQTSMLSLQYYLWLQLSTDISALMVQIYHQHIMLQSCPPPMPSTGAFIELKHNR